MYGQDPAPWKVLGGWAFILLLAGAPAWLAIVALLALVGLIAA